MTREEQHAKLLAKMESLAEKLPPAQKAADIVIGRGNLNSPLMFIGEAPGAEEAKQRKPFVGRSGQLFNKILIDCGLKREDFYVSNVVKARPPNNRDPLPDEITAFMPFLLEEIEIIKPRLFVSLGRFGLNFFLPDDKISAVHGVLKRIRWQGEITFVLPVYHPAAALRNGYMLEALKRDLAKIPQALKYIDNWETERSQLKNIKEALF
jgi:DNA polymerase